MQFATCNDLVFTRIVVEHNVEDLLVEIEEQVFVGLDVLDGLVEEAKTPHSRKVH